MKHDFETTQAILTRRAPGLAWLPVAIRKKFTPAALWSSLSVLAVAIAYVVSAHHDIRRHQESIDALQVSRKEDLALLQAINTQLAVVNTRIGDIANEVERQREWRERIEDVAEAPPHAGKRTLVKR